MAFAVAHGSAANAGARIPAGGQGLRGLSAMPNTDVALIGSGYWGRNLARVLSELGRLNTICDPDPAAGKQVAETYDCRWRRDFDQTLADPDVKALVIAAPAALHADLTARGMAAGKDVFVEKPLALRDEDARRLSRQANETGRILMVGHLLQYHPAFLKLGELVADGRLGRLNYIYSHRLNLGKIRTEENILWSFAPHDISMILALARDMPEKVEATGHAYLHGHITDITMTHMEFPSGLRAHIFVSWLHPYKEQKLVVVGDRAMAVFDDTRPLAEKLVIYPHSIDWRGGQPIPIRADAKPVEIPDEEPLKAEMTHFLNSCATRTTPRTDAAEGVRVLRVLNAAQRSVDASRAEPSSATGLEEPGGDRIDATATVHPSAAIDDDVEIGAGTRIWHFSHVLAGSRIGADCIIGQNCMIGPRVGIGRGCKLQNNVSLYPGVVLEDEVFCGPSCVFTNVLTPRAGVERKDEFLPTRVEKGATIGANATIICGNAIGRYAMVGAGAVVTKDVAAHALVIGSPARQVGWVSETGERLGDDLVCPRTGEAYEITAAGALVKRARVAS